MTPNKYTVVNGWILCAHQQFLYQYENLITAVEILKQNNPSKYKNKNATKRLAAIQKLIFEVIPNDPARSEYRLGNTLGEKHKHWFRAKFFQQYRLFFRFHKIKTSQFPARLEFVIRVSPERLADLLLFNQFQPNFFRNFCVKSARQ